MAIANLAQYSNPACNVLKTTVRTISLAHRHQPVRTWPPLQRTDSGDQTSPSSWPVYSPGPGVPAGKLTSIEAVGSRSPTLSALSALSFALHMSVANNVRSHAGARLTNCCSFTVKKSV